MKILVDTNVVLDLLLDRQPFSDPAARIFSLIEHSEAEAFLCATTVTTIDYLLTQSVSRAEAKTALLRLLELFEIAPVNRPVLEEALQSRMEDFEDAVLAHSANLVGATAVITRNTKDFRHSPVKALDPLEFLSVFGK
ncbi:MAG: PIN domain-containing protein [Kiritimatiellales bacterium]|nr:PIN domain-containing protein [Kiritimatiellota bacterium]MBL7012497.1 PIN domain-containing protein [Kiritimatiellales bacterium]